MTEGYFQRVTKPTPTKFWVNNPNRQHADWAIAEGAHGCINNPSYSQKMIDHPSEGTYASIVLDETIRETNDDSEAIALFQRKLVKPIADRFLTVFQMNSGADGYVSIQGDPINENDPCSIVHDVLENRRIGENICCKTPTSAAGLQAMEMLVAEDVPLNATGIFGISQMVSNCEMYEKISRKRGRSPKLYISHIAGIHDDYLQAYVADNNVDISPVVNRLFNPIPQKVIDELMKKLPHFKRSYLEDGLGVTNTITLARWHCSEADL